MYSLTTNWPFIIMVYPVFLIIILSGIKKINISSKKEKSEVFSIQETNYLRGIAALMVLFLHLVQKLNGQYIVFWYGFFGFLSVGFFMFVSGYSSYIQYEQKGDDMFKGFLMKRFIRMFIPFFVIDSIFAICFKINIVTYLKSILCIRLANSNSFDELVPVWFLFINYILGCFFFVSFKCLKKLRPMLIDLGLTVVLIIILIKFDFGFWWYNTALAYFYGMIFAKYKQEIIVFFQRKIGIGLSVVAFVLLLPNIYYMGKGHYTFVPQSIAVFLSIIVVLGFFSNVSIRNNVLNYIGRASLELFLLQGLRALYFNNNAVIPGWHIVVWIPIIVGLSYVTYLVDLKVIKVVSKVIY